MDPTTFLFQKKRIIFLTDTITEEAADRVIQQLLCLAAQSSDDIFLCINSPGGSVQDGLGIYDIMTMIPCNVLTVCLGKACSMAAVLLAAGSKRYALPNSEVMIHQVMGRTKGQAVDIQIAAERIKRTKHRLDQILAKHTGRSMDQICADTDRDHFMDPMEAKEYGLVDEILTDLSRFL